MLIGARENIRAFRHKVHTAENDVAPICVGGNLREFVGVAGVVGKANHFIALIMVSENHAIAPELTTSIGDALIHRVIGEDERVIQRA